MPFTKREEENHTEENSYTKFIQSDVAVLLVDPTRMHKMIQSFNLLQL